MAETSFLQNPSVAAFVGAASAFFLITLNDWRRKRVKRRVLKAVIDDQAELAKDKIEGIRTNLNMLKDNQFTASPFMPFSINQVSSLHNEVVEILNSHENKGIHILLYWMSAIDKLLDRILVKSEKLEYLFRVNGPNNEREFLAKWILDDLNDAIRNMDLIIRLFSLYTSGEAHKMVEFEHEVPKPPTLGDQ